MGNRTFLRTAHRFLSALFCACILFFSFSCSRDGAATKSQPIKVSFAQGGFTSLLPELAKEKGFFAEEGIEAELAVKGDGKSALNAMLSGEMNFCLVGEPPLAKAAWERDDFTILATLMTSENSTKILTRADTGIKTANDLRGKKIATVKGIAAHFFLDLFLSKNRIGSNEAKIVFLEGKDITSELLSGKIDAYAMTDRYFLEGFNALGGKARVLSEPGLCFNGVYLTTSNKFATQNGEVIKRILRALIKTEGYIDANGDEVVSYFAASRKISEADAKKLLADQKHSVSLTQPAILALEDNARWVGEKGFVTKGPPPNFIDRINPEPLRSVKPDAVRLFK